MNGINRAPSLILLAAGSGSRMGGPKALLRYADGTALLTRQVERMSAAIESRGLTANIIVVLGPAVAEVSRLVPAGVKIVQNPNHANGLSTSLSAGLQAVPHASSGAVISLVDLPDIPVEAYGRLLDAIVPDVLARAQWRSKPGHPVAIGREHFAEAINSASGDEGLRAMLRHHKVCTIECADLLAPELDGYFDVDTPEAAACRGLWLDGLHS